MNSTDVVNNAAKKGSVFGGILLVSGCCIGAGMLGLPVLSAVAGLQPSLLMLVLSWAFMAVTGLLFLEVNLWFKEEVNMISMAGKTLGMFGKVACWISFCYLFYALMVAFISGSGALSSDFVFELTGVRLSALVCGFAICVLFGIFLFLGTRAVDHFNRVMILGLVLSYLLLVITGFPHINVLHFLHSDWIASAFVVPTMITSFGYHNLVPSLTNYLDHDYKRIRITIVLGSLIPLVIYAIWITLLIGIIPVDGQGGFREALSGGEMVTQTLKNSLGAAFVTTTIHYLAFFSIVTSLLAVGLSFVDFLADGLKIKKDNRGKALLCLLTLGPPFLFAAVYPKLFFSALGYAGGFGAVFLFGVMPVAMVWAGRYRDNKTVLQVVPGGRPVLIVVFLCSLGIIALQGVQLIKDLNF